MYVNSLTDHALNPLKTGLTRTVFSQTSDPIVYLTRSESRFYSFNERRRSNTPLPLFSFLSSFSPPFFPLFFSEALIAEDQTPSPQRYLLSQLSFSVSRHSLPRAQALVRLSHLQSLTSCLQSVKLSSAEDLPSLPSFCRRQKQTEPHLVPRVVVVVVFLLLTVSVSHLVSISPFPALFVAGSRGNRSLWASLRCRLLVSSLAVSFSLTINFSFAVGFLRVTRFDTNVDIDANQTKGNVGQASNLFYEDIDADFHLLNQ
ncbi:uncharacterized protein LOC127745017 [Arachis duranensis]|uniref:Uncharacterized protein LOC127745017 n=1 Tax=Arachis duranensis TaxID=130453 RepID=A0A9C6WQ44_ARADU|nr:uncharacterized protein LOC127745017 [Arachis duranensis]